MEKKKSRNQENKSPPGAEMRRWFCEMAFCAVI